MRAYMTRLKREDSSVQKGKTAQQQQQRETQQQQQRKTQPQQQQTTQPQQQKQRTILQNCCGRPSSIMQQLLAATTETKARAMARQRIIERLALKQANRCQPQGFRLVNINVQVPWESGRITANRRQDDNNNLWLIFYWFQNIVTIYLLLFCLTRLICNLEYTISVN